VVGLAVAARTAYEQVDETAAPAVRVAGSRLVYVVIAISGFTALSAQVVWTRLLSLLFGAST
jgi:hypothetical protein